jgi:cold shock CspA family protein
MHAHGTLIKWQGDRGFGFVALAGSGEELFVHISAFPRDGRAPIIGETIAFEIENAPDGRRRAVRVRRAGAPSESNDRATRATDRPARRVGRQASRRSLILVGGFAVLVTAMFIGQWFSYTPGLATAGAGAQTQTRLLAPESPVVARFRCDGRQHCSQMRSCDEAKYFLQTCPGTKMDGDNDGVPCEQQWCR